MRRSALFITFTGEEHGLVGSLYYAANPLFPRVSHAGMIDLDTIGGEPGMKMNAPATGTNTARAGILERAAEITGSAVTMDTPRITSDADRSFMVCVSSLGPGLPFCLAGEEAELGHRREQEAFLHRATQRIRQGCIADEIAADHAIVMQENAHQSGVVGPFDDTVRGQFFLEAADAEDRQFYHLEGGRRRVALEGDRRPCQGAARQRALFGCDRP